MKSGVFVSILSHKGIGDFRLQKYLCCPTPIFEYCIFQCLDGPLSLGAGVSNNLMISESCSFELFNRLDRGGFVDVSITDGRDIRTVSN